jgi:hypothetical protein
MNLPELLGPIENAIPLPSRKAVLWGPEILLMDSVEFFLKSSDWEVIKLSNECGVDYLIQRVTMVKPAVIILCQERDASDFALLMQLAKVQLCLKIVVLSLESNLVQVYSKQNLVMSNVSDLFSVVES